MEKCVGHRLKLLEIVRTIFGLPQKIIRPFAVASWLHAD